MPEGYDARFYTQFMDRVFHHALPFFLHPIVLADRGKALIDPHNPLAREPFKPDQLIDMHGSFTNREGIPYVACKVRWRPPGMKKNPSDHGHSLYKGDGKGGSPDVCQKVGAKVVGWYYGRLLPEKKVAWEHQCRRIYEETAAELRERFQGIEIRHARYAVESSVRQAVSELTAAGCRSIIYQCFSNPVYSDFEDYSFAIPQGSRMVDGQARVIFTDQLGNQPALREAFIHIIRDRMAGLPREAKVLLILSRHGHPFRKETQDKRGQEYRLPLETGARAVMQAWAARLDLTGDM